VTLPEDVRGKTARLLAADGKAAVRVRDGWASFQIKSVLDHEVIVIS
jgi:hypothetical protein